MTSSPLTPIVRFLLKLQPALEEDDEDVDEDEESAASCAVNDAIVAVNCAMSASEAASAEATIGINADAPANQTIVVALNKTEVIFFAVLCFIEFIFNFFNNLSGKIKFDKINSAGFYTNLIIFLMEPSRFKNSTRLNLLIV